MTYYRTSNTIRSLYIRRPGIRSPLARRLPTPVTLELTAMTWATWRAPIARISLRRGTSFKIERQRKLHVLFARKLKIVSTFLRERSWSGILVQLTMDVRNDTGRSVATNWSAAALSWFGLVWFSTLR